MESLALIFIIPIVVGISLALSEFVLFLAKYSKKSAFLLNFLSALVLIICTLELCSIFIFQTYFTLIPPIFRVFWVVLTPFSIAIIMRLRDKESRIKTVGAVTVAVIINFFYLLAAFEMLNKV